MKDLSEDRFAWLLEQRGYSYVDEDHLGDRIEILGSRPDFWVETPVCNFLAEVKGFIEDGPFDDFQKSGMVIGPINADALKSRISTQVQHAAKQLGPYREERVPLLVVLDNCRQKGIALDAHHLVQLLGALEIVSPLTPDGRVTTWSLKHGKGQILSSDWKTYISAVSVNLPKAGHASLTHPEKERPMRLRILHNPYAAMPLPREIFSDQEDEHIVFEEAQGQWVVWPNGGPVFGDKAG